MIQFLRGLLLGTAVHVMMPDADIFDRVIVVFCLWVVIVLIK